MECDPDTLSYLAKTIIMVSIILTFLERALPSSAVAIVGESLTEGCETLITSLKVDFIQWSIKFGYVVFGVAVLGGLGSLADALPSGLHGSIVWAHDSLKKLHLPGPIAAFAPFLAIGIVIAGCLYCVAWTGAIAGRLHPFGAIGVAAWAFDASDILNSAFRLVA